MRNFFLCHSALDSKSEEIVQKALDAAAEGTVQQTVEHIWKPAMQRQNSSTSFPVLDKQKSSYFIYFEIFLMCQKVHTRSFLDISPN